MNRWYADMNPQHIVLPVAATCISGTSEQRFASKPARGRRF